MSSVFSKAINLYLICLLVITPLFSAQAAASNVKHDHEVHAKTNHTQSLAKLKQTNNIHHKSDKCCTIHSGSNKRDTCMNDKGFCPDHINCCSVGVILSSSFSALPITGSQYETLRPQHVALLALPTEIKPPR